MTNREKEVLEEEMYKFFVPGEGWDRKKIVDIMAEGGKIPVSKNSISKQDYLLFCATICDALSELELARQIEAGEKEGVMRADVVCKCPASEQDPADGDIDDCTCPFGYEFLLGDNFYEIEFWTDDVLTLDLADDVDIYIDFYNEEMTLDFKWGEFKEFYRKHYAD